MWGSGAARHSTFKIQHSKFAPKALARGSQFMFLHLDVHLNEWAGALGPWLYVVLFLIIFCETGLVVAPFLPGDSLLFAVGAIAADPKSGINVWIAAIVLLAAATL